MRPVLAPVPSVGSTTHTPDVAATHAASGSREAKLHKAAAEFEALFVKQLLKEAHLTGGTSGGAYGDMAVEALASGVERGGGLGLGKAIEHALDGHVAHRLHAGLHAAGPQAVEGAPGAAAGPTAIRPTQR